VSAWDVESKVFKRSSVNFDPVHAVGFTRSQLFWGGWSPYLNVTEFSETHALLAKPSIDSAEFNILDIKDN
jgi:hypothetical protein